MPLSKSARSGPRAASGAAHGGEALLNFRANPATARIIAYYQSIKRIQRSSRKPAMLRSCANIRQTRNFAYILGIA
jgi:hypothetical protein